MSNLLAGPLLVLSSAAVYVPVPGLDGRLLYQRDALLTAGALAHSRVAHCAIGCSSYAASAQSPVLAAAASPRRASGSLALNPWLVLRPSHSTSTSDEPLTGSEDEAGLIGAGFGSSATGSTTFSFDVKEGRLPFTKGGATLPHSFSVSFWVSTLRANATARRSATATTHVHPAAMPHDGAAYPPVCVGAATALAAGVWQPGRAPTESQVGVSDSVTAGCFCRIFLI
jgi:hypothetical protein